jgi:hypothetical protein
MKRLGLPIFIAALLGAFLFWWFSPVQIIKRKTKNLLETLTLQASTGTATRQLGVYSLNALLADEVTLESTAIREANGSFERSEMESAYSWLCQQAKHTQFDLISFHSVTVSNQSAEVAFSLQAVVELPAYRPADGPYEVIFRWQHDDDGWKLASATWSKAGQKSKPKPAAKADTTPEESNE